jgi:tetratricopeptide (TPR) repeat protein
MLRLIFPAVLLLPVFELFAQSVTERAVVYQVPAMNKVLIKENIVFRNVNDTSLTMDLYYPPGFDKRKLLPLVIFNNGVGLPDLLKWRVYKDWAKLMAANGMIALNYQSRRGNALADSEALIDYVLAHAAELNVDPAKIGLWTCSGNARVGMRLAHKTRPKSIRALVVYYGGPDSLGRLRQDLPMLVVRAGLDAQYLNISVDNFVDQTLKQDARIELVNYLDGIHAFDIYTHTDEAKSVIRRTIAFMKANLENPVALQNAWTLTNRNFMWMAMNGEFDNALAEFRKARQKYRADSTFHPYYNAVIREDVLNTNAYWLLRNQRQPQALEVFKLLVESYPESPNAYDGLADAFEALGDKSAALSNAEKALQKLDSVQNISPQMKEAIRKSASEKIARLKTGP